MHKIYHIHMLMFHALGKKIDVYVFSLTLFQHNQKGYNSGTGGLKMLKKVSTWFDFTGCSTINLRWNVLCQRLCYSGKKMT